MMQQLRKWSWTLCLVVIVVGLTACTNTENPSATAESMDEATALDAPAEGATVPTGLPVLTGVATVEMQINGGTVVIEVDGNSAPITAGNFVDLVQRGVYDGVSFHRVVKTPEPFVVQGGDPQSKDPSVSPQMLGTGSFVDPDTNEPRYIPLEIQPSGADTPIYSRTFDEARISEPPALTHMRGAVAMARSQLPDSASAQFYFALADLPFLDGSYAVFGYVTEGMDVVDSVEQGDIVDSATVVSGIENLQQPE
ncbi:peptidylprolyl isomerase [Halomicronema sp. CCY15110]|uniref:peptidylprolyl isomerase n=1 Tax=Halomicronema sp. CCY15110 TaxID=2767773 RepID=UPI001951C915|nr:peptidylprolyl isomerase [Halomicronema sp. CCY15110]